VKFFGERTITDMNHRNRHDLSFGNIRNPNPADVLRTINTSSTEKVRELKDIAHQVRCNLVHGSKGTTVDDFGIVSDCIRPLVMFFDFSLEPTRSAGSVSRV